MVEGPAEQLVQGLIALGRSDAAPGSGRRPWQAGFPYMAASSSPYEATD